MMHPLIEAAAAGRMPEWTEISSRRAEHIARVAALLGEWAVASGLGEDEVKRWRAAGTLHDVLHDASPDTLRPIVADEFKDLPGKMLHGPACAVKLRAEGVTDEGLMHAITYHTFGHPDLQPIGLALYAADYLEPGRPQDRVMRGALRAIMPQQMEGVVPIILRNRILEQINSGRRIRTETLDFWNAIPDEQRA